MKSESELGKCPFCDYPRGSVGFICERCGADLIWLIPWSEGGAALTQPPEDSEIMEQPREGVTLHFSLASSMASAIS